MPFLTLARGTMAAVLILAATPSSHGRAVFSVDPVPPVAWAGEEDPADSLYRAAREAMNAADYKRAARMFADIADRYPRSAYAADALYYRSFSLYKAGGESNLREALAALDAQKARFPRARTISDAAPLAVRIRGALAQLGDATAAETVNSQAQTSSTCGRGEKDDDVRSEALNALLQMDSQSAVPIIQEILKKRDACSVWMRKKAVFLLSQKNTGDVENMMIDVVRNDPSEDVRSDAVFWLGQVHTDKAESLLLDIAANGRDIELRKKAIFALTQQHMSRGQALIRKLAEDQGAPEEIRKDAIWQLGQQRSPENVEELKAIFSHTKDEEVAKSVLFSLSQVRGYGVDKWLLGVAQDRSVSEDIRKHALFCAGQAGVSTADLVSLYDRSTDRAIKEQLIWVMSDSRDRSGTDKLIDIARNDRDVEMRKKALFWLGQKNDPRVKQLLLDIIKGE